MAFLIVMRAWITAACVCHVFAFRVTKRDKSTTNASYESMGSRISRRASAGEHDVAKVEKMDEGMADDSQMGGKMSSAATSLNRALSEVVSFEGQQWDWFRKFFGNLFMSGGKGGGKTENADDDYYSPDSADAADEPSNSAAIAAPATSVAGVPSNPVAAAAVAPSNPVDDLMSPAPAPSAIPPYGWSCSGISDEHIEFCSSFSTHGECLDFEDLCVWSLCEATGTWKAKHGADKDLCPFHHVKSKCVKSKQCTWKVIGLCTATDDWKAKYPKGVDLCPLLQDQPSCTEHEYCDWHRRSWDPLSELNAKLRYR